jgi:CheY-like chemotaxis protein
VTDDRAADPSRVRVLVADDEKLMRAGLRLMIDGANGVSVIGEAADGAQAIDQVERLDPDVVLMDIRMPGTDGIEATRRLGQAGVRASVVVLTAFDTDTFLLDALRAGGRVLPPQGFAARAGGPSRPRCRPGRFPFLPDRVATPGPAGGGGDAGPSRTGAPGRANWSRRASLLGVCS